MYHGQLCPWMYNGSPGNITADQARASSFPDDKWFGHQLQTGDLMKSLGGSRMPHQRAPRCSEWSDKRLPSPPFPSHTQAGKCVCCLFYLSKLPWSLLGQCYCLKDSSCPLSPIMPGLCFLCDLWEYSACSAWPQSICALSHGEPLVGKTLCFPHTPAQVTMPWVDGC